MCNVSMVMDQYRPYIPYTPPQQWTWPRPTGPTAEELRELIESFRDAVKAAEVFDRLTGQPDCVDPEKAELVDRVAELERRLDEMAAMTGRES